MFRSKCEFWNAKPLPSEPWEKINYDSFCPRVYTVYVCYLQIASMAKIHNASAATSSENKKICCWNYREYSYSVLYSMYEDDDLYLFPSL